LKAVLGAGKAADDENEEGVDVEDAVAAALATRAP
jgi:hypothetical protein